MKKHDLKNILVFRVGHLGDTIISLPAFWAIRRAYPNAKITFLSNSSPKGTNYVQANAILPEKGIFDDWLSYPNEISSVFGAVSLMKLWLEIRRNKYDSLIYLQSRSRMKSSIGRDEKFFRIAGIKKIFGTEFLKQNLLDLKTSKPSVAIEPEWKFFVRLLNQANLTETEIDWCETDLLLDKTEYEFAENWLKNNCKLGDSTKIVAVAPSSKWESKIWDEENYYRVIAKLIESHGIFPVVFGGIEDKETGNRLIERWKTGANAAGALSVRQATAAFSHCAMYLGNDTGTMHIAAAMKIPCVAIFSALDWKNRWSPFGTQNKIFRETVECEGCQSAICPNNNKCLKLIEYSDVLNACFDLLGKNIK